MIYIYTLLFIIYILFLLRKETKKIHISKNLNAKTTLSLEIHCIPALPGTIIKEIIELLLYLYKNIYVYTCLIESLTYSLF